MRMCAQPVLRVTAYLVVLCMTGHLGIAETTSELRKSLQPIRILEGRFVLGDTGEPFAPWGFNYVGVHGKILEEYWEEDWPRLERDFREMRSLGANVVRLHLQVVTYMKSPQQTDKAALKRLRLVLDLAQEMGLYLDLTGLGCYRASLVPSWYDELAEPERWQVQATFWEAIAQTCAGHPAVFCFNLMNEPVIGKPKPGEHPWLLGELGGMHFVQRISNEPSGRERGEIAAAWVQQMVEAIRRSDGQHLVTVGIIPWAQIFPQAKPLFYAPDAAKHLDFVSVHFYPKAGEIENALQALSVYDIDKPLVVEEIFPLSCSLKEVDRFIEESNERVDGWISHYFGHTPAQHRNGAEPAGESVAEFLEYWREKSTVMAESAD